MSDSTIPVTPGSGNNVDTRTESTNNNHRQVVVLGDPSLNDNVAAVATQDVGANDQTTPGLLVRLAGSAAVQLAGTSGTLQVNVGTVADTVTVKLDPGYELGSIKGINSSIAAHILSSAGTLAVNVGKTDGTVAVRLDPGYELGSIKGINSSINVHVLSTNGSIGVNVGKVADTVSVRLDPGYELGSIKGINSSINVHLLSTAGTLGVNVGKISDTVSVYLGATAGTIGVTVGKITDTVSVYLGATAGTLGVTVGKITDTIAVNNVTPSGASTADSNFRAQRVLIAGAHAAASIQVIGITNSISTYISGTAGTLGVRVGQVDGSVAVYFSPSNPTVSATFSAASLEVVPTTGSRKTMDDAAAAQRVLIVGSQTNASLQIVGITNSINVHLLSTAGTLGVRVGQIDGSVLVHLGSTAGTLGVTVGKITDTVAVHLVGTAGTIAADIGKVAGSVAVYFSPANPTVNASFTASSLTVVPSTGSRILYDLAHQAERVLIVGSQTAASLQVSGITASINAYIGATAGTLGVTVGKITDTVYVYLGATAGTIGVTVGKITDTVAVWLTGTSGTIRVKTDPSSAGVATDDVAFPTSGTGTPMFALLDDTATDSVDEGDVGVVRMTANRILMTQNAATASIFTVSGTTSGVSVSGVTLVSPSASYNFKVYAYSIMTTGLVSLTARFTNGAGTSPTDLWRALATPNSAGAAGANLAVQPPGFLFATGTNTTLALLLDTATLVHYSVSYIKESA